MENVFIILPNQLFKDITLNRFYIESDVIFLIEEDNFFSNYKYHKMKLILHRSSMKCYYDYIKSVSNKKIHYISNIEYNKDTLENIFKKYNTINTYDPIDHDILRKYIKLNNAYKNLNIIHNPLFLESNEDLDSYYNSLKNHKRYTQISFYKWIRTKFNILMDTKSKPLFGKLSYDHNTKIKFDKNYKEPKKPNVNNNKYIKEGIDYVNKNFSKNVGETEFFIYPINFSEANKLLNNFIKYKLLTFADYEDTSSSDIDFGSHSLLSSSINIGIITVKDILKKILHIFNNLTLLNQKKLIRYFEIFIRQILGWRSYIRFIYRYHGEQMYKENRFNHEYKLSKNWYNGNTGIYPIDIIIKKANRYAYCHHIERLMYIGNFMLLNQIHPIEVHKWFMTFFIDSYTWVMVPNVNMSQYSSTSIIMMTKPYFSSSNYIKLMSNYKLNTYNMIQLDRLYYWNEIWDILYYNFINKNQSEFSNIYSLSKNVYHWKNKVRTDKIQILKIANMYMNMYMKKNIEFS